MVNGEKANFPMKVGEAGEAYFLVPSNVNFDYPIIR